MDKMPVHEWLRPQLEALVLAAEDTGFRRDVTVAAIIDIITAPPFDQPLAADSPE